MMQAVILAGGLGTRLWPLTSRVPKPLVLVHGKPFLQYQLELLKFFGITDVLLLVSYLGEQIEEYFHDGSQFGLRIQYSHEDAPLGTGGALKNAEGKLREGFLLLNGDTLLAIDYQRLVASYQREQELGLIVAFENPDHVVANNLAVAPDNRIVAYNKREPTSMTHVDAGVSVFSKRILDLIPPGRVCSLEEETYPELIERQELWAFPTQQLFYDMGSFPGLETIADILR